MKTTKNRISQLDNILNNSRLDDSTICIGTDGSVPKDNQLQGIGAISAIYLGERKAEVVPCGTCSSTDAELAALRLGLEVLPQAPEIKTIRFFSDSTAAIQKLLDPSTHSLQGSSIASCEILRAWFIEDQGQHIYFHYVPSKCKWKLQGEADKLAKSISLPSHGGVSSDTYLKQVTQDCLKSWSKLFQSPEYRGNNFLFNLGTAHKPSFKRGGPWLFDFGPNSLMSRWTRTILNHAPIGEYRRRFLKHLPRSMHLCKCGAGETRLHILLRCPLYWRRRQANQVFTPEGLFEFLDFNKSAFMFREGIG